MENGTNMNDINKVAEAGTEIATKVVENKGLINVKKIGVGTAFVVAGAVAGKCIELLVTKVIKPKTKKAKKNEEVQPETSEVETEFVED